MNTRPDPPADSLRAEENLPPALLLQGVCKSFGGLLALDNLTLAVRSGEVHGLIGPNGAGKTTAVNVATGVYRPDQGSVWIGGEDVTRLPPHARARKGLGRTFQGARLFERMTVFDNMRVAVEQKLQREGKTPGRRDVAQVSRSLIQDMGLAEYADARVKSMPYGKQKQLEVARVLAWSSRVLLLDEPTAGLSDHEIEQVLALVLQHRQHRGIIIIEHNMDVIMTICDRVTVMDAGKPLATGTPGDILQNPAVIKAYLGV